MPRHVSSVYRWSTEALFSEDVDLIFLTITHPAVLDVITVVSDTIDYVWGIDPDGKPVKWLGVPFEVSLLTDDDSPPKATLNIQNIDRKIGEELDAVKTAARMRLQLLCSHDFDLSQRPRVPLASFEPEIIYDANALWLVNVKVDDMAITGDIQGWDYLQRAWPGRRATKDVLPGLFR